MSKKEFLLFAAALKTYYPNDKLLPNEQALELWYQQLKDIPYEMASAVLNKWVSTNKFAPAIADIREQASAIRIGTAPEWGEAWESVMRAVRRYGIYQKEEALASLDDLTRRCAERVGFRDICMSENIGIERASFRDIYNRETERRRRDAQVPEDVKKMIEKMSTILIEKREDE